MPSSLFSNARASSAAHRRRASRAAQLETLEQRVLLDGTISGSFDVANTGIIAGWAYDSQTPNSAINVQITIDGVAQTVPADQNRPDLAGFLGTANHGFFINTPMLSVGTHQVSVAAVDPFTLDTVVIGGKTITNAAPIGSVDIYNDTTVAGWAYDADAGSTPIQVRVDVNGATTQTVTANQTRTDLQDYLGSSNHGFNVSGDYAGKIVEVVALDVNSGNGVVLKTNNIAAIGSMDVLNRDVIAGWAYDGNHPTDPIQVRVEVDGTTFTSATANGARPDLQSYLGSANHGYIISLTGLPPGSHNIKVFARDPDSLVNGEVQIGSGTVNSPPPIGYIDVATNSVVAGWAYDPDAGAAPIMVKVMVDGQLKAMTTAAGPRSDLQGYLGSMYHGYNVSLSGLTPGPHKVQLYGVDDPSNTDYLIATTVIDNQLPIGSLDIANLQQGIWGWAADRDPTPGPVTVKLVIDGVDYGHVDATDSRPDLTGFLGSADHGYHFAMPTLTFGQHQIQVFALDTFTEQPQLLGSASVTNHSPIGSLDLATPTQLAGWVFDPDAGANPIDILISRDGTIVGRTTANINRPDLQNYLGSTDHGFNVTMAPVTGTHVYIIYAVDPMGVTANIGQKTVAYG